MASPRTPATPLLPGPALAIQPGTLQPDKEPVGGLLDRLAKALDAQGVAYCQWKGHWSAHRWTVGEADIDLLVDRAAAGKFRILVEGLGFKATLPPAERQIPGIESYFGFDTEVPRPLHLHVHYRLVLGEYWRTTYRIPIERPLLESAVPGDLFRVPAPAYQFLIFVLRMTLRQRSSPLRYARLKWLRGIKPQLDFLEETTDRQELARVIGQHLTSLDLPLFDRCVASLRGQEDPISRFGLLWRLHWRLRAHARSAPLAGRLSALFEKALPFSLVRLALDGRMRLAGGGKVIALIGGDGAGKSTCASKLADWLSEDFLIARAHLGNPPRSALTLVVGAALKAEQALRRWLRRDGAETSHLELLRHCCTARDCHRLYQRVSRFATRGGIAICERYPTPQTRLHVGPRTPALLSAQPSALARRLRDAEVSHYQRILPPDQVIVLRLDPELAVMRKPEEPADYVRARGRVIWETDWSGTATHVVDASRPLPQVLRQLQSTVWSAL
jgi:thymidylate kinase